jgi:hypothetical protein
MRRFIAFVGRALAISFVTTAVLADASMGGLPPWHFQMTPQEVASFTDYGPYDAFRNGDLETYSGLFDGHKENVQFFFRDGKLVRIGIYLYEGQDVKAAANMWGHAYAELKTQFGDLNVHGIQVDSPGTATSPDVIATAAGAAVDAGGKVQMAPRVQPLDKFVFASISSLNVQGHVFYYVRVFYDQPHDQ